MAKITIIAGSVRPGRFNIQPATWITEIAKQHEDIDVQLVDLAKLDLPFYNEAVPASQGKYELPHTKEWAKIVKESDGFVFVTPEYNHSYSPVLKNAIDYLFAEWNYKPVAFVSYGSGAGGSRAVEHLRGIAAEIKMYDIREQIMLPFYWTNTNEAGEYQFTEEQIDAAGAMLDQLAFWAEHLKQGRRKLADKQYQLA